VMYFIILLISVVVNEGLAELVSKSMFFGPFRDSLASSNNGVLGFFSRAITCPYCCSVWTAMFLTTLVFISYRPILTGDVLVDAFLFLVACHRLANHLHDISDRYFSKDILK